MTGIADCCARATRGHVAAETATILMNSRRLTAAPKSSDKVSYRFS